MGSRAGRIGVPSSVAATPVFPLALGQLQRGRRRGRDGCGGSDLCGGNVSSSGSACPCLRRRWHRHQSNSKTQDTHCQQARHSTTHPSPLRLQCLALRLQCLVPAATEAPSSSTALDRRRFQESSPLPAAAIRHRPAPDGARWRGGEPMGSLSRQGTARLPAADNRPRIAECSRPQASARRSTAGSSHRPCSLRNSVPPLE